VAVTLQQDQSSLFAFVPVSVPGATIATRAVAIVKKLADTCILALDPAQNAALSLSNASLPNANCAVASNSTAADALSLSNATINGPVSVVGGWSLSNNAALNGGPNLQGAPAVSDPYSSLAIPSPLSACTTIPPLPDDQPLSLTQNHFCGWYFGKRDIITLGPGTYYIDQVNIGAGTQINGPPGGVTIVVDPSNTGLPISVGNGAVLNLVAPGSGSTEPFPGIALMDLSTITSTVQNLNNNVSFNLKGAIYFRNQTLNFSNNVSLAGGCTQIIARVIHLSNNVNIDDNCSGVGVNPLTIKTVALAE
jgi:hypothetical protein